MPAFTINGFTVDVSADDAEIGQDNIENATRMFDGSMFVDRRFTKRIWSKSTPPVDQVTRDALRHLINGEGETWSFNDGLSSVTEGKTGSKGSFAVGTLAFAAGGQFGTYLQILSADATFPSSIGSQYSVGYWRNEATLPTLDWHHILVVDDGMSVTKWRDGVQGSPTTTELTIASGNAVLAQANGYDDVVVMPWALTPDLGDQYPQSVAFASLPVLEVAGDIVENAPAQALGFYGGAKAIQSAGSTLYKLSFELREN